VDESKQRDYLLVAAVLAPQDLAPARRAIRGLLLPGQPRLHMKQERDSRRRKILSTIDGISPELLIYRAPSDGRTEIARRDHCLRRLVDDLHRGGHTRLCLELDQTLRGKDLQTLIEATHAASRTPWLDYRHERARDEALLAIPDAVAWAWSKGGDWQRRCGITTVIDV